MASEGTRGRYHRGNLPASEISARFGPTDVRAQQQYKRKYYFVSLQHKHYSAIRKEFSGENFAPPSGRRIAPSAAPQAWRGGPPLRPAAERGQTVLNRTRVRLDELAATSRTRAGGTQKASRRRAVADASTKGLRHGCVSPPPPSDNNDIVQSLSRIATMATARWPSVRWTAGGWCAPPARALPPGSRAAAFRHATPSLKPTQ